MSARPTLILDKSGNVSAAVRIALAAKRWADAEAVKVRCNDAFREAWLKMIDRRASDEGKTVLLYYRDENREWCRMSDGEWVGNHPDVIAQEAAWKARVASRKSAGIARAALTRMVRRWAP